MVEFFQHATVNIKWVDSEELNEENVDEVLGGVQGILVPVDLVIVELTARSRLSNMQESMKYRSLVFALACSFPSLSMRVISADWKMHTASSLIRTQAHR